MIDILRHRPFFPLKDFEDVEKLFEFNLDTDNGEPNLALLSIVCGLVEHSLVTVNDKQDLINNSRPVTDRKRIFECKTQPTIGAAGSSITTNCTKKTSSHRVNSPSTASSSNHHHLSSTSNEPFSLKDDCNLRKNHHKHDQGEQDKNCIANAESNEVGYVFSDEDGCSNEVSDLSSPDLTANDNLIIPEIEFEIVETLYKKFVDQFRNISDFKDIESHKTNLKIKKISDSVWEHLSNSYYKDKAHLQSIFSYLTTNKLDCFGLAFAVIAGCQILNLKNIYLALSEDHAWVMFDQRNDADSKHLNEYRNANLPIPTCAVHGTCEVTWHGKANSDKRGQPVTFKNCWLYTNGYAVKCDIKRCVVALVNSINPSINSNTDSEALALLQQRLLWLLYKYDSYFPMSLGNLGELENLCPTPGAPLTALELFKLGIEMSRTEYNDSHVYPYSYIASFYFKHGRFKEALETWADASSVMTKYNYSRDDEEIYKEFFEVANELLPSMLKCLTAGCLEPGRVSKKPFLQDPECLALILKFYDNICVWEEGSSTPVLHIGWAKNFVATVLKFSPHIRSKIKMLTEDEWAQEKSDAKNDPISSEQCSSTAKDDNIDSASSDNNGQESNNQLNKNKRSNQSENKVDTSVGLPPSKQIKLEPVGDSSEALKSPRSAPGSSSAYDGVTSDKDDNDVPLRAVASAKRFEIDANNNVTLILRSRKIAGVRDLLQADRLNKTAIELQLTAQSQCAVRGRSNSSSYSSDFISTALSSTGGSTRSKRLHRG